MKKNTFLSPVVFFFFSLLGASFLVFLAAILWHFSGGGLSADFVGEFSEEVEKIETETPLPHGSIFDLIKTTIRVILGLFSVLLSIVVLWSGTLFVIHFGDEEKVTNARKLLLWALVGVAVTASAYALVSGVIHFNLGS